MGDLTREKTPGETLRSRRERVGMRPSDLAASLGVDRRLLYLWETGRRTIPDGVLARAASLLREADPAGELLAAVMMAGDDGLTGAEAKAVSPHLTPATQDRLTADGGPLRWAEVPRTDARGRSYMRRVLLLNTHGPASESASAPAVSAAETKGLRILLDLQRAEFAALLGVTVSTVGQWERGPTRGGLPVPAGRVPELINLLSRVTGEHVRAARSDVDLSISELARASGVNNLSSWENGKRRAPGNAALLAVAAAIATAPVKPLPGEAAWRALRDALDRAGMRGLDRTSLMNAARAGRQNEGYGVTDTIRRTALSRHVRSGEVEQFGHLVPTRGDGHRAVTRYRLAGLTEPGEPMTREELCHLLQVNEKTATQLARELQVSGSAVLAWSRGTTPIRAVWASSIRQLLRNGDAVSADELARRRVLKSCEKKPGTRISIIRAAGYGKENRIAEHALDQLIYDGKIHRHYLPSRSGRPRIVYQVSAPPGPVTGRQIRDARERLQLSRHSFGTQLAGVRSTTIMKWERAGDNPIPAARWAAMHDLLSDLATRPERLKARAARPHWRMDGADLRARRKAAGLSLADIAEHAGVATGTVSGWQLSRVPPRHVSAVALALDSATPPPNRMSGAELRGRRHASGLTFSEFAELLGVPQGTARSWEAHGVPRKRVQAVTRALDSVAMLPEPIGGTELRTRRRSAGLTQRQLADMLGVKPGRVRHWEARGVPHRHVATVTSALTQR